MISRTANFLKIVTLIKEISPLVLSEMLQFSSSAYPVACPLQCQLNLVHIRA